MPYRVSYTTDVRPSDTAIALGRDIEVESIGREFPVVLETGRYRRIEVCRDSHGGSFIRLAQTVAEDDRSVLAYLPRDVARELAHSLLESIGELAEGEDTGYVDSWPEGPAQPERRVFILGDSEPSERVVAVEDDEGDMWYRRPTVGHLDGWRWTPNEDARVLVHDSGRTWRSLLGAYGPLTATSVHPW